MRNHSMMGSLPARALGAAALLATLGAGAGAQEGTVTTPWRAWLGCWSAGAASPLGAGASAPLVCITPGGSANVVQISTVADGKVIGTQRVDASGREVPLDAKGCTGTEIGRWSADGRRVYLTATATCDGTSRTTDGILAMTPAGEWLDVQGVKVGGSETVRVARYHDVGLRAGVPADLADAVANTGLATQSARAVAGATIGTAAVAEASRATSVQVTEAFVLERGQSFALTGSQLVALADAGMSPRLTDAMIAVSNPQTFAVGRADAVRGDSLADDYTGRRVYVALDPYMSPWGWGYGPYGYSGLGYGYGPYGYNAYGPGYGGYGGYGSGYGYGYGYPGSGYGGVPVVIVRGSEPAQPHGRVVKGRGYEQGARTDASSPSRNGTRSETTTGGSTNRSSGSERSAGSGERTARPRP